jgi:SAM-dependent methyltransferase
LTDFRTPFDFGGIGLEPATSDWGFSRGLPVDRPYIEAFLARHAEDIRGRVLEVGDSGYTRRFGGERVTISDVLDIRPTNPRATFIDDITNATTIPSAAFDCLVFTQVLVLCRPVQAAMREMHRILKPGGVALITVPGISHISPLADEAEAWSWSFYPNTLRWLLTEAGFAPNTLQVEGCGNLKTTVAFLAGLAQQDLLPKDYEMTDRRYPLIVTARAVRPQLLTDAEG